MGHELVNANPKSKADLKAAYQPIICALDAVLNLSPTFLSPINSTYYYVPGFNTHASNCAVRNCGKPPPPGVLFAKASGCETIECTNAPVGWYYTQVRVERTVYLHHLECPVEPCRPPKSDRRFVSGFAADHDACPTQPCDRSRLRKGYYFQLTDNYTECTPMPCEAIAGHFYLHSAEGGPDGCAKVRSKCTNAKLGEKYAVQADLVLNKTACPVEHCDAPPIGMEYASAGSCDRLIYCTDAKLGQYYINSTAAHPCQVANCTNALPGQFYATGNTEMVPDWQLKRRCPVGKCAIIPGYTFKEVGKCSHMQQCALPDAGTYFQHSHDELCKVGKCVHQKRGHWKYVPGFVLRPDKCPRQKCAGDPPQAYVSLDSCDAVPAPTTTTTEPPTIPPLVVVAASASRTGDSPTLTTGGTVAIVIAGSVIVIAGIIVVAVICYCLRMRNKNNDMHNATVLPVQSPKVPTHPGQLDLNSAEKGYTIANNLSSILDRSDLLLDPGEVTLGQKLAEGGNAQIYVGRFADQDVALKESHDMLLNGQTDELVREASMMTKLRHHNIVRFFGIWQPEGTGSEQTGRVFLVMELCPNGDLKQAAEDPGSTLQKRQQWIMQVASAMDYLHGRTPPIVHRDLKPHNVLLDAQRNAKVCDFGTSKAAEKSRDMTAGIGTVAYMAPEMMRAFTENADHVHIDGIKCDVFSFAILALHVATGQRPHAGLDNLTIFMTVGMQGGRTPIPPGYAGTGGERKESYKRFVQLVQKMWQSEPEDRPGFDIVVRELDHCFS